MEVEGTRSRRNLKKSGTEGSTNSDRAVYSAVCRAQSNDGQTYVGVGKLNGRPVKVLRDTGCTGMIVDRALVPEVLVIPGSSGSLQMVDHTLIDVPLANVYLDSPYYKGHCRVMCVSSPVYPVIIGNVRGARRMLPDPDWKAEDQPGVRARTSGGNKDGIMMITRVVTYLLGCLGDPTRRLRRVLRRRETQRRNQPSPRKVMTVLGGM